MADNNKIIYPRIDQNLTVEELNKNYLFSPQELEFIMQHANMTASAVGLALLLIMIQKLKYFVLIKDCPLLLIEHIAKTIGFTEIPFGIYQYDISGARWRHINILREYLEITEPSLQDVNNITKKIAKTKNAVEDIINATIEELIARKLELPSINVLEKSANKSLKVVNANYYKQIFTALGLKFTRFVKKKILVYESGKKTVWHKLKKEPEKPTINKLQAFMEHIQWLQSIDVDLKIFADIPVIKMERMFNEAIVLNFSRIKRLPKIKRCALVAMTIRYMNARGLDDLIEMLVKHMRQMHDTAKQKLIDYKIARLDYADELIEVFHNVVKAFSAFSKKLDKINAIAPYIVGNTEDFLTKCTEFNAYKTDNYLPFLLAIYVPKKKTLLSLSFNLKLRSPYKDTFITEAIAFIKSCYENNLKQAFPRVEAICEGIKTSPVRWQQIIIGKTKGASFQEIELLPFELYILTKITQELMAGDLFIARADRFSNHFKRLVSWKQCKSMVDHYTKILNISKQPKAFVEQLQEKLADKCWDVDQRFHTNESASFKKGKLVLKKIQAEEPFPNIEKLETKIAEKIEQVSVIEVVTRVTQALNLEDFFGPASGNQTKLDFFLEHLIATLFCYGCNLDTTEVAKSIKNINRKQIGWINAYHITEEKLDAANRMVINKYNLYQLPNFWGDKKHAVVDSTHRTTYDNNLMAVYHARYKEIGGLSYSYLSSTYIALFGHFMSGMQEAIHMIDSVYQNKSAIQPEYIHGDTHAQNLIVFGICYLLGIKLMPRIKGIKKLIFYKPDNKITYNNLDPLFRKSIKWSIIQKYYRHMLRTVMTIKEGKVNIVDFVKKICTKSKKNKLYYAFLELGRVCRTLYLLDCIDDFEMRKAVHAETCKVEEFHDFVDWISIGGDKIRTNERIEQQKMIKCWGPGTKRGEKFPKSCLNY